MSFGGGGFGSGGFGSSTNNNTFGGFGSSNNNNQQPQNTGFGSSTGFGSAATTNQGGGLFGSNNNTTGGFGSSGGFGTNNNNATTGFGRTGFGTPATSAPSLFGGSTLTATSTPATTGFGGGGGFGSTQTQSTGFGSGGGLFGGNNNNQTQNQGTGFGSTGGSSLFGGGANNNTTGTTGFGSGTATTGFGGSAPFGATATAQPVVCNGSANPPFQATVEKETGSGGISNHFQSTAAMQAYQNFSHEEMRVADYQQGRKYGNASGQPGAFGQSSFGGAGFGATNNTSGFGGSGTSTGFGQTATTGGFGSTQPSTSGFGSTGGGLFGNQAKPAGTGLFGSTATTGQQQAGGLFGNNNQQVNTAFGGSSGFGNNANNNTTGTGGGLFGNNQNQNKPLFGGGSTGGFGNATSGFGQSNPTTGSSLFGGNAQTATTSAFGQQNNQQGNSLFGGNSAFGQNQQNQNQAQQGSGLFGGGNSAFGNQNQQKPGGLFGNAASTTTGGAFGAPTNQQSSGGLFGNNQQQNQQQQGGSLFGQNKPAGLSLFGNNNATNNNATGSGLSLFNNQNQNQNQNQSSGLFGQANQQKPSLFGSTTNTNTGGGLFGGLGQSTQTNTGSLFGASQSTPNLGGIGAQQLQQSQQPQQLTTSIMAANPYGNDQLFADLGTPAKAVGPLATPLTSKSSARKPMPLPQYRINPAASSRLITPQKRSGYGFSYSAYGTPNSAQASPDRSPGLLQHSYNGYNRGGLARSQSVGNLRSSPLSGDSIFNPAAFASTPRGGYGGSLKKLNINRSLRRGELFGAIENPVDKTSPLKKRVSFDNGDSASDATTQNGESSTALVRTEDPEYDGPEPSAEEQGLLRSSQSSARSANINGSDSPTPDVEEIRGNELAVVPEDSSPPQPVSRTVSISEMQTQEDLKPGHYWMKPTRAELNKMPTAEKKKLKGFVVGREGCGQIEFSEVDLTSVDLDKIYDNIVELNTRIASVHTNFGGSMPPGKGLNVPATVTLMNTWPRARAGKVAVYDRKGPRFDKHLQRLKRVRDTEFVEYRSNTGEWVFRVPHFSTYAFNYEDFDDDESVFGSSVISEAPDSPSPTPARSVGRRSAASNFASTPQVPVAESPEVYRQSRDSIPGAFDNSYLEDDIFLDEALPREVDMDREVDPLPDEPSTATGMISALPETLNSSQMAGAFPMMDGVIDLTPQPSPTFNAALQPKSILKPSRQEVPDTPKQILKSNWADQLQRSLSPKKQDRRALREAQHEFVKSRGVSQLGASDFGRDANPFATSIDVMNSLFGAQTQKYSTLNQSSISADDRADANNAEDIFTKSFRPTWSNNQPIANRSELESQLITPALAKQQDFSTVELQSGIPVAQLSHELTFSALEATVTGSDASSEQERLMWRLASVLFDPVNDIHESQAVIMERRRGLSSLWREAVRGDAAKQLKEVQTAEERALVNLSCHGVDEAVATLLEGKDFKLAAMVSQIGANPNARRLVRHQIEHWQRTHVWSEISTSVRAIYELLAGNASVSEGKSGVGAENRAPTFKISSKFNLDWKRSFGLRLWYATKSADSIGHAVLQYSEDLGTGKEEVKPDSPRAPGQDDVLWNLLKIYYLSETGELVDGKAFHDLFSGQGISGDRHSPRLSFQLRETLKAHDLLPTEYCQDIDGQDRLILDYIYEVGQLNNPILDAVFLALHISDPEIRERSIEALLFRFANELGDNATDSIVFAKLATEYKIPEKWLWTAKARHAAEVGADYYEQARCLLRADELESAHNVFIQFVGPASVVEEDTQRLAPLIADFRAAGYDTSNPRGWKDGAGLFAAFADVAALKKGGNVDLDGSAEALLSHLRGALPRLAGDAKTLLERAAAQEMGRLVARWTRASMLKGGRGGAASKVLAIDGDVRDVEKMSGEYFRKFRAACAA